MKDQRFEQKAIASLRTCLAGIPFVQVDRVERSTFPSDTLFQVWLRFQDRQQLLFVRLVKNGQPRFARLAVYELQGQVDSTADSYGLLIAPYISPVSAQICEDAGIGYLDLAGNCLLSFKTVFIKQAGVSNPQVQKRLQRSLYSPKSERLLRVLLDEPGRSWKMQDLAQAACVSLGQVANVKQLLDDREWIAISAAGFSLKTPGALLDDWAASYNYRRSLASGFYTLSEPAAAEADLAETCERRGVQYALTGFSGAIRIAPMVRYDRVMAYVQDNLVDLAAEAGFKPVDSGANVLLLSPYDEGVFYGSFAIGGSITASPLQVYLDVIGLRGRGQEAAASVRQKLEAKW